MTGQTLETLPREMIDEIIGHLFDTDVRTLRLVNKFLGSIANHHALREVGFCMCKRDFEMLRELAAHPDYPSLVASLIYHVETLSLERQTLPGYTRAIARDDSFGASMRNFLGRGAGPAPSPMTPAEIKEDFDRYTQFYDQQQDILTNDRDYEILREVIAKMPNLREVTVSSDNELASVKTSPFKSCRKVCDGPFVDGRISTRHLRAILSAVHAAKVELQSLRVAIVHSEFFNGKKFGLQDMLPLLGNVTHFEMMVEAVEDRDMPMNESDPDDIAAQLLECYTNMKDKNLRKVVEAMPNLVTLKLQFVEYHSEDRGKFPCPVQLAHVLPLDKHFPRLRHITLSNVLTDRKPLARFLIRHKESLKRFELDQIRLHSTSWMKFLPVLRSAFKGTRVVPLITDLIMGKAEDGLGGNTGNAEAWMLGHPDYDPEPNPLGLAVGLYIYSKRKLTLPLTEDNMYGWESETEEEEEEEEEDEFGDGFDEFDEDDEFDVAHGIPFEVFMSLVESGMPGLGIVPPPGMREGEEDDSEDDDELPDLVPM